MVKKSSYDDLETDYFDEEAGSSFLSLMSLGVAFLAVAAFIALAWYAYQDDGAAMEEGEIETVYADEGDVRIKPEGESGWQFPNAEREVYRLGSDSEAEPEVEQILPQPERPAIREREVVEGWINKEASSGPAIGLTDAERRQMEAVESTSNEVKEVTEAVETKEAVKEEIKTVTKAVEKKVVEKAPAATVTAKEETIKKIAEQTNTATPAPVKEAKPEVTKTKVATAPAAPKTKARGLTSNRLQLGAFGSRAEALKNWGRIRTKAAGLLSNKEAHIEMAEVKGKTYYRIQAYPFDSRSQADALCVMLKSRGLSCFAVKR
jgi:cell division protein FtsN